MVSASAERARWRPQFHHSRRQNALWPEDRPRLGLQPRTRSVCAASMRAALASRSEPIRGSMSSGATKPSEAVAAAYRRIEAHADPALFIALRPQAEAAASAAELDDASAAEKPLLGQTFAIKDNIDFLGLPTTAACPAFSYKPPRSAFVVERLERAGAFAVGK